MTPRIAIAILGVGLSLPIAAPAFAQSYTAPAGIPAVTAPGGVEGRAALPNIVEAQDDARGFAPRGYTEDGFVTGSVRELHGEPARHRR